MKKLLSMAMSMLACTMVYAGDIYVDKFGNDNAPGTKEAPVATIQKALRIAREWRRTDDARVKGGITIWLQSEECFYLQEPLYLRPEDSGTPDSKTIITSTDGKKARIVGMDATLSTGKFTKQNGKIIAEYDAPLSAGRIITTRQLWNADTKMLRAQHCQEGLMERMLDFNTSDRTITIPTAALTKFGITKIEDAPQLEMIVHQRWAIAILRVREIKIEGDKAILSFKDPESTWEFEHPWPQPVIDGEKGSSSFILTNAKQFLDEQDEWWQDYSTGKIYRVVSSKEWAGMVVLPTQNRLITIEGSAAGQVHDIIFRNIAIEYASWERPARYGHVTLQGGFPIIDAYKLKEKEGLPWAPTLENQAWVARPEAAVSVSWAHHVDFDNCTFAHLASTALDYSIGCQDINITNNDFTDIGGTAVLAGSFAEGATEVHRPYIVEPESAYCEKFHISANTICDATNEDWGCVGIGCGFVRDFIIEKNEVSNVNYSGICVGWGWTTDPSGMRNNVIRYNTVHDFALNLYDAGGIYTLSNQPRSVIQHNHIYNLGNAPYATNNRGFYIYLDAMTDGYRVTDNIMPENKIGYNNPGSMLEVVQ